MSNGERRHLYILLKNKLHKKGIIVKWWIEKYLDQITYSSAVSQLNGNNPMSDYIKNTVKKYLES